jgi:hypothetical protein
MLQTQMRSRAARAGVVRRGKVELASRQAGHEAQVMAV